ncbi:MAG: hypothetical protein ACJA2W_001204 [Planctomycetota bacterium]|jgi:hypothetical protein
MRRLILCTTTLLASASLANAQVTFTDVTDAAGVNVPHGASVPTIGGGEPFGSEQLQMSGGAAAGDFNGDGWVDLFVTRLDAHDVMFLNRGNSPSGQHRGFLDVTERCFAAAGPGPRSNGAVFGDVDNDGDLDLYLTAYGTTRYQLWINDGAAHFTEEAQRRGAAIETAHLHAGQSPTFGDFDRDGWLDLYVGEWMPMDPAAAVTPHARLLRNRGASAPGQFEDVTVSAGLSLGVETGTGLGGLATGVFQFTPRFSDLDDDGWPDLAIAGDFGTSHLFWNNGDGTFHEGTAFAGVAGEENGMGATIADFNGDGRLDWFVTSIYDANNTCASGGCAWGASGNRLYINLGGRRFADRTDAAGVRDGGWGWGTTAFDYDNDGDIDLGMTNGIQWEGLTVEDPYNHDPMRFWRNDGGAFTEVAASCGLTSTAAGKGFLALDYDRDGDLDLYVVHNSGLPVLYRNDGGNRNDWLQIELQGTSSTRDAAGARVELTLTPGAPSQVRELSLGSNFLSQDEALIHFGLGAPDTASIARVVVRWPSGRVTTRTLVPRNQRITLVEP